MVIGTVELSGKLRHWLLAIHYSGGSYPKLNSLVQLSPSRFDLLWIIRPANPPSCQIRVKMFAVDV